MNLCNAVLNLILGGLVFLKEKFSLVPINQIPIIPTALARNLEGPAPISEVQGRIRTGLVKCLSTINN